MIRRYVDLANPRVQKAKESFEKRHQVRNKLNFEQLLFCFATDESFESIGKSAGLTTDGMWKVFNKDFREIFPHRTRRLAHQERKKQIAETIAFSEHPFAFVREAAARAREYRYTTETIPIQPERGIAWQGPYKHLLFVNDRMVRVYEVRNLRPASASGDKEYAKVRLIRHMLEEVEFAIFNVAPPGYHQRFFVVPSALLLEKYFKDPAGPERKHLYIPLARWPVYHRSPRIDMWKYLEAWHLLQQAPVR